MDFVKKTHELVLKIPYGTVATYGQIAAIVSTPRAARTVGVILRSLPANAKVPWWRVINSRGMVSIENLNVSKIDQASRLQAEGIEVKLKDGNYWVDLKKYLWDGRD